MTKAPPHPTSHPGGAGSLLLKLVAGLLVVLAGVCAAVFIPFTLLFATTAAPGELAPGIALWMIYAWCLFAFLASIGIVMAGVGAIETPRPRRVFALLGVAALIFVSFPPFVPAPA